MRLFPASAIRRPPPRCRTVTLTLRLTQRLAWLLFRRGVVLGKARVAVRAHVRKLACAGRSTRDLYNKNASEYSRCTPIILLVVDQSMVGLFILHSCAGRNQLRSWVQGTGVDPPKHLDLTRTQHGQKRGCVAYDFYKKTFLNTMDPDLRATICGRRFSS